jgi:hypothetical protein
MGGDRAASRKSRWALGPRDPQPVAKLAWIAALGGVLGAVGIALVPWTPSLPLRGVVAVVLVVLAAVAHRVLASKRREPRGWLVADERGLKRTEPGKEARLIEWRETFGVTVLARADRRFFVVALTSPRATRFVPVRIGDASDVDRAPTLVERATTAADSDLRADESMALSAADAEQMLRVVSGWSPGALDRVFLCDAGGEPVVLDRAELRVGGKRIDLSAPLEWRALIFQELGSHAASLCQATWVRQGEGEVVLVAPMPADTAWLQGAPDVRLMQAHRGDPPPRELRRAIDHVFMLPLRRALDRAPRISRAPSPASPPPMARPEGRA